MKNFVVFVLGIGLFFFLPLKQGVYSYRCGSETVNIVLAMPIWESPPKIRKNSSEVCEIISKGGRVLGFEIANEYEKPINEKEWLPIGSDP